MLSDKENHGPLNAFSLLGRLSNQKGVQNLKIVSKKAIKTGRNIQESHVIGQGKSISSQTIISKFFSQPIILGEKTNELQIEPKLSATVAVQEEKPIQLNFSLVTSDGDDFQPSPRALAIQTTWEDRKKWFDTFFAEPGSQEPTVKQSGAWATPYGSTQQAPSASKTLRAEPSQTGDISRTNDGQPYTDAIFRYLRSIEFLYSPRPIDYHGLKHYWEYETSPLTADSRSAAIQWVWKICKDFGFSTNTAFLTVNLFDRYFECKVRMTLSSQFPASLRNTDPNCDLVVLASLYIAYKHSEVKNYEFWHVLGLNTHLGYLYSKSEVQATG